MQTTVERRIQSQSQFCFHFAYPPSVLKRHDICLPNCNLGKGHERQDKVFVGGVAEAAWITSRQGIVWWAEIGGSEVYRGSCFAILGIINALYLITSTTTGSLVEESITYGHHIRLPVPGLHKVPVTASTPLIIPVQKVQF
ncbi:hypothetical protein AMTR_s00044p00060830 [Amborella trichopoda]|uniref:Uncharacterized protein n=1 Tax=Amborella trichopoda TaxID=13333 RepID=U5D6N7_AMBTC|nr:hypothetical protein AMTR_s00044p00060830 [Amborella trichopoda]